MGKNDFDIDFDFEKEYGINPDMFGSEGSDFDFDSFLSEDIGEEAVPPQDFAEETESVYDEVPEEIPEDAYTQEPVYEEEEDLTQDFFRRNRPVQPEPEYVPEEVYPEEPEYTEDMPYEEEVPYEQEEELPAEDYPYEEEEEEAPAGKKKGFGLKLPKVNLKGRKKPASDEVDSEEKPQRQRKPKKPSAFSKFLDMYMEPVTRRANEDQDLDPLDPKVIRRKKREKKRIFKEVYLPAIIAAVAMCLILSFVVGFVANLVRSKKFENLVAKQEAQTQADAASRAEQEYHDVIAKLDEMVLGYDYEGAIQMLDQFAATTDKYQQELQAKRGELVNAQYSLQEIKDISTVANLSFHVLVADPARAFTDAQLGGQYNKNFVTVEEFSRILNQLYSGNYVLVDFNSFVKKTEGVDGNASFFPDSIYLPAGKKPIMLTETMVNYFEYMVDSNKDGEPDAGGHGFANKLVVDENGDIKAAYVDGSGTSLVGNYDFVPVLEDFIKEHPDFSYRGARAILAVTGTEGIFGYRTNTSYVASVSQTYYDEQVIGAKKVVEALREKGYTLASYTYSNQAYRGMTTLQIQAEMQNWTNQITPVMGEVDTIVFARSSDIEAYSGTTFNVLYNTGFRFFLNSGTSPRVDVNTTFVKQTRLMVSGEAMTWYSNQFSSYFDCNMVLDMSVRPQVAKS